MKKFHIYYQSGVGHFVTNENGLIVFGPGFGTVLPEWGNSQAMAAYFEYIGFSRTKSGAVRYIKEAIFFQATHRNMENRRKKTPVGERRKRVGA